MKQKLLTIAVPTYNGSKTIKRSLDSIFSQYDERVEVLVSNNCSTDKTFDILKVYEAEHELTIINNTENIGPDGNFLQCYMKAEGKFTLLLSDDDVLVEGALNEILNFLTEYHDVKLVHLRTVDFRETYIDKEHCISTGEVPPENIYTSDKKVFMRYAKRNWGFMSSYICATDRVHSIVDAEQFFGTFWLQSYIHIICAKGECMLGSIKYPCVGAGRYLNVNNFDSSLVDGTYYRKMLDYAVSEAGFNKKQLDDFFVWRFNLLERHNIIKERAAGIKKTNIKRIISITKAYPSSWFTLYPFMLIPPFICRWTLKLFKQLKGITTDGKINRPE